MPLSSNEFPPIPVGTKVRGCGFPYALICRGGQRAGHRPSTTLAFITFMGGEDNGRRIVVRGLIRRGSAWSKHPRPIPYRDIVTTWRAPPSPKTVAARRKALKPERVA